MPLCASPDTNIAFQAALKMVFEGHISANGYTEFILGDARRAAKLANKSVTSAKEVQLTSKI